MKKKQRQKVSRQQRESKGVFRLKKDEKFCKKIVKNLKLEGVSRELTKEETMEMLSMLLNSCRYSIERTKNKGKPTYYGLFHQYLNRHEMLSEFIHKTNLLSDWANQYLIYKEKKRRMDFRPTIGRIDHEQGYTLDNIEVQAYVNNAAQRAEERFSKPCVTLVAESKDSSAMLFECPSATNAIARINEVLDLGITKGMLHGNLDKGLTRQNRDYSVFIISRDKLLDAPMVIDLGIIVHTVIDDASVRLVVLPEVSEKGYSKVSVQVDELGIVYVTSIESDYEVLGNLEMKEEIVI